MLDDIVLIVLGLGIIGSSYVISEKVEAGLQANLLEKKAEESAQIKNIWTEKEEEKVRQRIDSIVEERVEQAIDKTEDELSRISNEKIMTSNEFSEQVLEKIEQNHEEVVFLYNMLNEKEKQMKALMQEIESLRAAAEKKMEEEKTMTAVDMLEKLSKKTENGNPEEISLSSNDEKEISQLREFAKAIEEEERAEKLQHQTIEEPVRDIAEESAVPVREETEEEEEAEERTEKKIEEKKNRNREILNLHKQGMTVLEISKALDMGQGEVKLVIDLFQGASKS